MLCVPCWRNVFFQSKYAGIGGEKEPSCGRNLGGSIVELALPRNYARKVWRAVIEFELLEDGDRVMVGFFRPERIAPFSFMH